MPEPKYFSLFENRSFALPDNFFDTYAGRPAAAAHEMGVWRDLDLVYDLKMLDREGELQTRYRQLFLGHIGRMNAAQRATWDAHYDPLIEAFKADPPTGRALAQWKFDRYMQDYLRCIQSVDDGVGELLDYLDEAGLTKNTIVVYTSDQGFYLGEHGWFDKRFMYEESFRTPLLVRYPREIEPGQRLDQLVQNLDLAPTFLDYAGVEILSEVQGESFRDLLNGTDPSFRDHAYYTYYEHPSEHNVMRHYGLRTDRYKLIHFYYDLDYWELYDLAADPSEMHNVYNDPAYREIKADLHDRLERVRRHYGDSDALNQAHLERYLAFARERE
jgi:arylsulfatase A-like enzyme